MSRGLFTSELEDEINERINDIIITLTNQEQYIKNNAKRFDVDAQLPIELPKTPNYKALTAGFEGLHIGNRNVKYHNVYLGVLKLDQTDIYIEKDTYSTIEGKKFKSTERIALIDFLQVIYEISEEQLRNLERVLFLFES